MPGRGEHEEQAGSGHHDEPNEEDPGSRERARMCGRHERELSAYCEGLQDDAATRDVSFKARIYALRKRKTHKSSPRFATD